MAKLCMAHASTHASTQAAWAKNKARGKDPAAIMFVPRTPSGELIRRLREAEEQLHDVTGGEKVKLVEKSGGMLKRILNTTNPARVDNCGRPNCLPCSQAGEGDGGQCKKRNITYKTSCLECMATGKKVEYFGETARSGFERGLEHQDDFKKEMDESHMWKHQVLEHPDQQKVKFKMKVIKQHRSAFQRQVHEAVLIQLNSGGEILNSRGEYNRCNLPRLAVMFGENESNNQEEERRKVTLMKTQELLERGLEEKRNLKRSKMFEDKIESQPRKRRRKENSENNEMNRRKKKIEYPYTPTVTPMKRKLEETESKTTKRIKSNLEEKNSQQKLPGSDKNRGKVQTIIEMFDRNSKNLKTFPTKKPEPNYFSKENEKNRPISRKKSTPSKAMCQTRLFQNVDATKPGVNLNNKANHSPSLNSHHHTYSPKGGLSQKKPRVKTVNSAKKFKTKPISDYFNQETSRKLNGPARTEFP